MDEKKKKHMLPPVSGQNTNGDKTSQYILSEVWIVLKQDRQDFEEL